MTLFIRQAGRIAVLLAGFCCPAALLQAQNLSDSVMVDSTIDQGSVVAKDLQQVFDQALQFSPKLNIAREQWSIGKARTAQATGQLLPQVTVRGSLSQNRRYADQNVIRDGQIVTEEALSKYDGEKYSAQLTQVLFNWKAFQARNRAAYLESQSEAEYYEELSWLLVNVAEKYLDVLAAEDALSSVQHEQEAVNKQLQQVNTLYQRQLAKVTDLLEAQARMAAVAADEIDARNQLDLAREALMEITGADVYQLFQLSPDIAIPSVEGTITDWLNKANIESDALKARRFALKAAEKGISEQRGAYLPQLTLVASHQKSDIGYENSASPLTETNYVGVDLTVPIFAGGTNRAQVKEAVSRASIARNELLQLQRELTRNIRAAYLQAQSSRVRTQAAEKLAESTRKSSAAMKKGFSFGTVTSVDVLNALRDEFVAERDLQKARYEHIKALLNLKRSAGVIGPDDLMTVNDWLLPPR